jgi:hypothetical protein
MAYFRIYTSILQEQPSKITKDLSQENYSSSHDPIKIIKYKTRVLNIELQHLVYTLHDFIKLCNVVVITPDSHL